MSETLQVYSCFRMTGKSRPRASGGSLFTPVSLTVSGLTYEQQFSIGTEATKELFDVDEDLADFDFLWIQTDYDVMLELISDDDADIGEGIISLPLKGTAVEGELGVPFILARDDSYANPSLNFGGTLDLIERIQAKNLSTTETATVYIFAVT